MDRWVKCIPPPPQIRWGINISLLLKKNMNIPVSLNYEWLLIYFASLLGVLPANTSLTLNDLEDVRQIESLIRAQILLAELAGHDSPCYKDYLLMAQAYIIRLLQVRSPL